MTLIRVDSANLIVTFHKLYKFLCQSLTKFEAAIIQSSPLTLRPHNIAHMACQPDFKQYLTTNVIFSYVTPTRLI